MQVVQAHFGPIPPATEFDGYEKTLPGAANRILSMAELEQRNRHDQSRWDRSLEVFGMVCALVFCILAIAGGFYCILNGHEAGGTIVASLPLAAIAGVFIRGRSKTTKQ